MYNFSKRVLDLCLTIPVFLLSLPLLLLLMILIKLSSKGPAIFTQERAGKNAKPFTMLKLRTMRTDVDPFGPSPKDGQDPRLTKVGLFVREKSLDELPQLMNIISGSMSIVGPRPLYISQIPEWNDRQKRRLKVKPGLTGLAQVSGRGSLTIEQKLELDVKYVEQRTFTMDLRIIFATIKQVIRSESIYEVKYSENEDTRGDQN